MSKFKTIYVCTKCGTESPKWQGRCDKCGEWNSLVEVVVERSPAKAGTMATVASTGSGRRPHRLDEIDDIQEKRLITPDKEMNRVLGGGIVEGSIVLLGGEPGIGKSTLLLQLALQMAPKRILYVSGEESEKQIRMRGERIGFGNPDCYILCETSTQNIFKQIFFFSSTGLIYNSSSVLSIIY